MPRFLLDTNIVSFAAKAISPPLARRLQRISNFELCTSSIVEAELRYGLERLPANARMHLLVEELLLSITVLPWDSETTRHFARLRFTLEQQGQPMGLADTMIAAHALTLGMTLVTNDQDFARVKGLKIQDWTKGPQRA